MSGRAAVANQHSSPDLRWRNLISTGGSGADGMQILRKLFLVHPYCRIALMRPNARRATSEPSVRQEKSVLREYIRLAKPQNIASKSGDSTYRSSILTRKRMTIPEIFVRLGPANHPSSENTFAITDQMHHPRHRSAERNVATEGFFDAQAPKFSICSELQETCRCEERRLTRLKVSQLPSNSPQIRTLVFFRHQTSLRNSYPVSRPTGERPPGIHDGCGVATFL